MTDSDDIPVIHLGDYPGPPEGVWPNKPKGPCGDCGIRPATVWFQPEGAPDPNHGGAVPRCERCCLVSAIDHCERAAARLPKLRDRLDAIDVEETARVAGERGIPWHDYTDCNRCGGGGSIFSHMLDDPSGSALLDTMSRYVCDSHKHQRIRPDDPSSEVHLTAAQRRILSVDGIRLPSRDDDGGPR